MQPQPLPFITVGITACNEGEWLKECWQSVLEQTFPNWRAVMLLDGNADKTTRKVFHNIEHPSLHKFEETQHNGPYPLRDKAIRWAGEGWYAHLDADDTLPPDSLERILQATQTHPEAEFIFGNCLYFNLGNDQVVTIDGFYPENLAGGPTITGTSPIQVSLYLKTGGYNSRLLRGGADWDFWIRVAELGAEGAKAEGVIYNRRRRKSGNVGSFWKFRREEQFEILFENHKHFFSKGERSKAFWGRCYEQSAKDLASEGRMREAALYARKALKNGKNSHYMKSLARADWPLWRRAIYKFTSSASSNPMAKLLGSL